MMMFFFCSLIRAPPPSRRYFPEDSAENRRRAIEREWAGLCMLEMDIEHMSGKEAKELAREGGSKQ